jgi:hypothetical protein
MFSINILRDEAQKEWRRNLAGIAGLARRHYGRSRPEGGLCKMKVSTMMIACGLVMANSPIWADDEARCTNKSLQGDYGFQIEGVLIALPGATVPAGGLPFRGVAMGHFDGKGGYSQIDHVVAAGVPPPIEWIAGTGSYTVSPNCTGTISVNIPGSPFTPLKLHIVVVRNGKEVRTVVTSAGNTLSGTTSVGIKID